MIEHLMEDLFINYDVRNGDLKVSHIMK